jgi:Ca2+/Na+ antiporter
MNFDTAETIKVIASANDWSANAAMLFCVVIVLFIFYLNRKDNKDRETSYREERSEFIKTLDGFRNVIEKLTIEIKIKD